MVKKAQQDLKRNEDNEDAMMMFAKRVDELTKENDVKEQKVIESRERMGAYV